MPGRLQPRGRDPHRELGLLDLAVALPRGQSRRPAERRLSQRAALARDRSGRQPHSPIGNDFPYIDLNGNQRHNTIAQPLGEGYIQLPRRQANGSLSVFQGSHELKLGADYQDIEMQQRNIIGMRFSGQGFNANLPGGFTSPQFADVFDAAGETATTSEIQTVYVQDRIALSERWTLSAGLRLDDQVQKNDVGQEASSFTEVAPRLSAVYDVDGSGKLLVKANAGRYYQIVSQDTVSREFALLPTGANTFDRFGWSPATQRYDIFQSRFAPAAGAEISDIEPYYKDEASVGVEWQFSRSWAFEAQAIAWEQEDILRRERSGSSSASPSDRCGVRGLSFSA